MNAPAGVGWLDRPEDVVLALHPLRRALLDALADGPASASGLADRVDATRQQANYHLRALEDAGLVVLVDEVQRRGAVERVLARTSSQLLVDPAVAGLRGLDASSRSGLGGVIAAAVTLLRQAATIAEGAARRRKKVAAGVVDADLRLGAPADLDAFLIELAELVARHDRPGRGSMRLRFTGAVVPHPPQQTEQQR